MPQTLTIKVTNKLDEKPTLPALPAITIAENIADLGRVEGAASPEEGTSLSYHISGDNPHEITLSADGALSVGGGLDYETLTDAEKVNGITLQIIARATRDGETLDSEPQTLIIQVTNKLDEKPTLPALPAITIAENIADLGRVEGAASPEEGTSLSYHISGDNPHEITLSADGALSVDGGLDYETLTDAEKANGIALQIIARATRDGETLDSEPQTLIIQVTNKLDEKPTLPALPAITIAENIADLGRVEGAASPEEGTSLSYHISGDNPHEITLSADGALSVDGGLDYETLTDAEKANGIALQIIARATRDGETLDSEPQTLIIQVTNKLDEKPTLPALPAITIAENIADLGRVEGAASPEEGTSLSYHISGDNPHEITLSADGALSVDGGLDYETLTDAEKANGIALQIIARAYKG